MTTFDEREQAFEAKYAHDENFRFLVAARRDKLFAKWLAARLRLADTDAADLTASILAVTDGSGHDSRLLDHTMTLLPVSDMQIGRADLAEALNACGVDARQQLLAGVS